VEEASSPKVQCVLFVSAGNTCRIQHMIVECNAVELM
jgi:hypothetical protein